MSATLGLNSLKIKFTGKVVNVPENIIAKLMYYLSCISTEIQNNETNIFTDYQK